MIEKAVNVIGIIFVQLKIKYFGVLTAICMCVYLAMRKSCVNTSAAAIGTNKKNKNYLEETMLVFSYSTL